MMKINGKTNVGFLGILGLVLVLLPPFGHKASACTSFMLKADQGLYFVHSLNQGDIPGVPGDIFINPRGEWKKGTSWETLADVKDKSSPTLLWRSKYGSVTFNTLGKDCIDGGMNEAGLYIWEMSFDTEYPDDKNKPKLFQMVWMQYQLDNFRTVNEVLENVDRLAVDGWGWHYFVADRSGKTAIIDFVSGKAVVYTGESMPVPMCCNSAYADAMTWLRQHRGFGGELEIEKIHQEIPRFVYGAELMRRYTSQNPVDYSFYMLEEMSKNVRWSVVIDVKNMTVYYKTNLNQNVRRFRLTDDDFGRKVPLMLNIEHPGPEDIRREFVPCTRERNLKAVRAFFDLVCGHYPSFRKTLLDDQKITIDQLSESFLNRIWISAPPDREGLRGDWSGEIKFPAKDGWNKQPVALRLRGVKGSLSGTVKIGNAAENHPISNISNHGGLLYFTSKNPDSGEVSQFRLFQTDEGLKGAISSWNRRKKAGVTMVRKGPNGG